MSHDFSVCRFVRKMVSWSIGPLVRWSICNAFMQRVEKKPASKNVVGHVHATLKEALSVGPSEQEDAWVDAR